MKADADLKDLLLGQYKACPGMRIEDMVKLIFQNEFAGGHLISDREDSLRRLREELRSANAPGQDRITPGSAFEDIGNGLCRLHLRTSECAALSPETINAFFVNTADAVRGSVRSFEAKLDVLRQCCSEGLLPWSSAEAEAYLSAYKAKGYPPVSHSGAFRAACSPAYRIVRSEYRDFFEVFVRIDALMKSKDRVIAAIDGNSGAGKSTLALLIGGVYDCNLFHTDDFFLTPELRTEERLGEPGGNMDYVRFRREVIGGIIGGRDFTYRRYDCRKTAFGDPVPVSPRRLNIAEGCYSMHPALADFYDLGIFLHTGREEQTERILKRSGPEMLKRFLAEWIPLEDRYFGELGIREKCGLVFER